MTNAQERPELKACPFCGGEAHYMLVDEDNNSYCVECNDCWASTRLHMSLKDDARPIVAAAWNRRTPAPQPDAVWSDMEIYEAVAAESITIGDGEYITVADAEMLLWRVRNELRVARQPDAEQWEKCGIDTKSNLITRAQFRGITEQGYILMRRKLMTEKDKE